MNKNSWFEKMTRTSVEPPDRGKHSPLNSSESVIPSTVTSSGMGGSEGGIIEKKNRTFEQIVADEKKNRNILEVKITRKQVEENGELKPAKALTLDDVSVMIFDVIGVKPQDCLGVALYTSRYDTKEIKMKPGVDISCYLTREGPIEFKNHEVTVVKQMADLTRVTFKHVPFNVPDEEILNLCSCYGDVGASTVSFEQPSINSRGVMGATRYVDLKITPGKQFENFYWLEGPLEGDKGSRITVLHTGQERQCSHCLRRENDCPGAGVGKVCFKLGTPRGQMGDYMKHLYIQHNYMSMKMKYNQIQFPHLGNKGQSSDGFGKINDSEKVIEENEEIGESVKNDAAAEKIAELQEELKKAKEQLNSKPRIVRTFEAPQELFEYDEKSDEIFVKDEEGFNKFLDAKCLAQGDKDKKKLEFRARVLSQVRNVERRKRNLSTGGGVSFNSPSRVRDRPVEDDDGEEKVAKQSRHVDTSLSSAL